MADIAASGVTYTLVHQNIDGGLGLRVNVVDLAFGDGVDTYPTGGIPLTNGKMGCPNSVESLLFVESDASNGLVYDYDASADKIRIYQSAAIASTAHTHNLHLNDADVSDGATTRINAGADLLGANTGGDLLVTGVANTSGVGGIVNTTIAAVAAGALVELAGGVATPAAATVRVRVAGW